MSSHGYHPPAGGSGCSGYTGVNYHNYREHFDQDTLEYVLEDTRLSTLQRRLVREGSQHVALALAFQVSASIVASENRQYIRRSYDVVANATVEVFYGKHGAAVKSESTNAVGKVGYVLAGQGEFKRFMSWLEDSYLEAGKTNHEGVQVHLLKCLAAFLHMRPNLTEEDLRGVLQNVQQRLELTDSGPILVALVDSLAVFAEWRPKMFEPYFQDVVDILIGWHIDSSQPAALRTKMSDIMLEWHDFWLLDLEFSSGLLTQFMEDLEEFFVEVKAAKTAKASKSASDKILALVQVFNTVLTCLRSRGGRSSSSVSFLPGKTSDWCGMILDCLMASLDKFLDEDLLIAGQHAFVMLCERIDSLFAEHQKKFLAYLKMSITFIPELTFPGQVQTVNFTKRMLNLLDGSKQSPVLKMVLNPNTNMVGTLLSPDKSVTAAATDLFKDLLKSKSITVLQDVYSYLLSLYEIAIKDLAEVPAFVSVNKFAAHDFSPEEKKRCFYFFFACISTTAVSKGSVLSMWALDPSIFNLLMRHSGLLSTHFMTAQPWLHHTAVKILRDHCDSHANFIASSDMLNAPGSVSSPTTAYFRQLLTLLGKLLQTNQLCEASLNMLLEWTQEILQELHKNQQGFMKQEEFTQLLLSLLRLTTESMETSVLVKVLKLDLYLCQLFNSYQEADIFLHGCQAIAGFHARSKVPEISDLAMDIMKSLPPFLTDWRQKRSIAVEHRIFEILRGCGQNAVSTTPIRTSDFKVYIESLLRGPLDLKDSLEVKVKRNMLTSLHGDSQILGAVNNSCLRALWIGYEVAQFCVANKLKTPLGPAQNTLTTIEKTLRNLTTMVDEGKLASISYAKTADLLVFFECLEKSLDNAYDGSAVILAPPSKLVAVFFSANKKTCVDWLSRMRVALSQLYFAAENYAGVVRNAYAALEDMNARKQTSEPNFQLVLVMLAASLCRLRGKESLQGLYVWCKEKTGKKLRWIKPLLCIVEKKFEQGVSLHKSTVQELLDAVSHGDSPASVLQHVHAELSRGHRALCSFKDYEQMMSKYQVESKAFAKGVDGDYMKQLSEFSDGNAPCKLYSEHLDSLCNISSFSSEGLLSGSHQLLLQAAAHFQSSYSHPSVNDSERLSVSVKTAETYLKTLLRERGLVGEAQKEALLYNCVLEELKNLLSNQESGLDLLLNVRLNEHSSGQLLVVRKWADFFLKYKKNSHEFFFHLNALNIMIAKAARKEENFGLAKKFLCKVLVPEYHSQGIELDYYVQNIDFRTSMFTAERASCLRQCSKIAFAANEKLAATKALVGLAANTASLFFTDASNVPLSEVSSRALHNLAGWVKADESLAQEVFPDGFSVDTILALEHESTGAVEYLPMVDSASNNDMVVGRLLRLALIQSPQMAKLWNSLADWALELGDKVLLSCDKESITLMEDERQAVVQALPEATVIGLEEVFKLLQHHRWQHSEKAEIVMSTDDYMRKELRECEAFQDMNGDALEQVLNTWLKIQKRTFFYHEIAVGAYFQFIFQHEGGHEDKLIAATLRILQLTVRHALELQDGLQRGLESSPSSKWRAIVPQLFARLNHPVRIVRKRISELLCRIAKDFPHTIIFPAVVGAASRGADKFSKLLTSDVNESLEQAEEENEDSGNDTSDQEEDAENPALQSSYDQIVATMQRQGGKSVEQVQRFVDELKRISLLWDELWLGTLQQYSGDVQRRVKRMDDEVQRLEKNKNLSKEEKKLLVAEKYQILFKPLIYVFEKVYALTDKDPETPHEAFFVKKYGEFIRAMMERIRNPNNPHRPKESWGRLQQLQNNLSNKLLSKTQLRLDDISPSLSSMEKDEIPMPGVSNKPGLSLDALENTLNILLTKTKPKKVYFKGNDGRRYTYLFKGLEDLHLDERVMQFLSIANTMMRKPSGSDEFKARHYSVIPLGPRSGLIQWVGGSVPFYSLFKKWQMRQQANFSEKKGGEKKGVVWEKPGQLFFNKIYPLLHEQGVTNVENRKEWPASVTRQVMKELIAETPDNLISNELWLASTNSEHWFSLTQSLTRSMAVMCVIGYIIGLGDRHLDNLLLDINRGEVIHIDYNVCFEKGKHLRIPERVPCRLTQNVVRLFGLTGVEGLFRASCEHTLEAMRKGKETLITLLEAFVYDPLVDWTPGVDMGIAGAYHGGREQEMGGGNQSAIQDKRNMQTEITFSMLGVRIAEIKTPWKDNKTLLLSDLSLLEDKLATWMDTRAVLESLNDELARMHNAMSVVKEAEANPNHRLYTLHGRYLEHMMVEKAVEAARAKMAVFIEENEKWTNLHQRAVNALTSNQIQKWIDEVSASTDTGSSADLIYDFLSKAGQTSLVEQFQTVESAFCIGLGKMRRNLIDCLMRLNKYGTLASLYPQSYRASHRNQLYIKWTRSLSQTMTVAHAQELINDFTQRFVEGGPTCEDKRAKQHHLINLNFQMESWTQDINFRVQAINARMTADNLNGGVNDVYTEMNVTFGDLQENLQKETADVRTLFLNMFMPKLAGMAKRLLGFEKLAAEAGASLMDCMGADGKFFLMDEVFMEVGVAAQLLEMMGLFGMETSEARVTLEHVANVSKALLQLNTNYFGVILQEGIKSFTKEDQTVLTVAFQVTEIINAAGMPLEELIQEVDAEVLRAGTGDVITNSTTTIDLARIMRSNYEDLVNGISDQQQRETLTPGQMLFLAFDSLFNNIDLSLADLKMSVLSQQVMSGNSLSHLDIHAEGEPLLRNQFENPDVAELLSLSGFLLRLLVIKEYFNLCSRVTLCFKAEAGSYGQTMPSGDELARPIKMFQAEYFRRLVCGFTSRCLATFVHGYMDNEESVKKIPGETISIEEIAQKFAEDSLKQSTGDKGRFFGLELDNLVLIVRKSEVAKCLQHNLTVLEASREINHLQRSSFQWFHEADLQLDAQSSLAPPKTVFMQELRNSAGSLLVLQEEVAAMQVRFQELHTTVEQRMKWACGANPELRQVFDAYTSAYLSKAETLKELTAIMRGVVSTSNSLWHHEALRAQTREAVNNDSSFMALMGECQESASLRDMQSTDLGDNELRLFSLCPPTDMIDSKWIRGTEEMIAGRVKTIQQDVSAEKAKVAESLVAIKESSVALRNTITSHQKLMSDVGSLLRTISKSEEYEIPEVNNYLVLYKEFQEVITAIITGTMQDEQSEDSMRALGADTDKTKSIADTIYDELVSFAVLLKEENLEAYKVKQVEAKDSTDENGASRRSAATSSEEKNDFALNVLRRVRLKLEGREPDALKRSSVPEQVDFIIREATSVDNLAHMYEGWTAWI